MSQTKKIIEVCGKKIVLIGTAHVSAQSVAEVESEIRKEKPDCVAIELDEQRFKALNDAEAWKNLDIVKILKEGKGFLLMANLVLSSFQRKMGEGTGVRPGDEMRVGIRVAEELGIPSVMVDRPIQTTLRRAWAKTSFFGKSKLLVALIGSAFDDEEVSTEQIESLKNKSEMDGMMGELSRAMPVVKEVLIDERDRYLAAHIWKSITGSNDSRKSVLAVLGAGHLPGVESTLQKIAAGDNELSDTTEIGSLPKKSTSSKILKWIIPALILALIVTGFVIGGRERGATMLGSWLIWNGVLAGVGALLAAAHPLAILVSVVGAPFTSLCPFIGIGFLSGLTQAMVRKPKVVDLENVQNDISLRGIYKNRLLRILLVFLLSSIGSSIGTFVAGTDIVVAISKALKGFFGA